MSLPATLPLSTTNKLKAVINAADIQAVNNKLFDYIVEESDHLQRIAARRFDEYITTQYYALENWSIDVANQYGQLVRLKDGDLKSVTEIRTSTSYNELKQGNGTVLTLYDELPMNYDCKDSVGIINNLAETYVAVRGVWGYGGMWVNSGALSGSLTASATTIPFTETENFERGMQLRIGTEYLYCDVVTTDTSLTVVRGINGSTAATHAADDVVYTLAPVPTVQTQIRRLVAWRSAQINSPLAGQVIIGEFEYPVEIDSIPNDVEAAIIKAHLRRISNILGVDGKR